MTKTLAEIRILLENWCPTAGNIIDTEATDEILAAFAAEQQLRIEAAKDRDALLAAAKDLRRICAGRFDANVFAGSELKRLREAIGDR